MSVQQLLDLVKNENFVFIQPHDFPDPDAIAAAYGLQSLLGLKGIKSYLVYEGEIQRDSLKNMIRDLDIHINKPGEYEMIKTHKIIIVDGCKGNDNVSNLIGEEIGVIDHHEAKNPEKVPYVDIRSDYGSCSTIIFSYFTELKLKIPPNVANALFIGLNLDTARMTRKVSDADIRAYAGLYKRVDDKYVQSKLRNNIELKDLVFFQYVITHLQVKDNLAFCYLPKGCNQNLLGIIGDFILSLGEINFSFLCAKNSDLINFSVRNELENISASHLLQHILSGIGSGGGHADMAGGVMPANNGFDEKEIFKKVEVYLQS